MYQDFNIQKYQNSIFDINNLLIDIELEKIDKKNISDKANYKKPN